MAVLYFQNHSPDQPGLDGLAKGLCSMMIADVRNRAPVDVVERERLQTVTEEIELSRGAQFDSRSAAEYGRLLGAQFLLLGSFFVVDRTFVLTARVVEVETGVIVSAGRSKGRAEEFDLLAANLTKELVEPFVTGHSKADSGDTRPRVPSEQVNAYGRALDAVDLGHSTGAKALLRDIVEANPGFYLAGDLLQRLDGREAGGSR